MAAQVLKSIEIATATYTVLHCIVGRNYGELPTKNGVKKVLILATSFTRDLLAASLVGGLATHRFKNYPMTCVGAFFLIFAALRWFDKTRADEDDPVNQICNGLDVIVSDVALLALVYKPLLKSMTYKSS